MGLLNLGPPTVPPTTCSTDPVSAQTMRRRCRVLLMVVTHSVVGRRGGVSAGLLVQGETQHYVLWTNVQGASVSVACVGVNPRGRLLTGDLNPVETLAA